MRQQTFAHAALLPAGTVFALCADFDYGREAAAASNAFFHGFSAACLVAAGVSAVAAIATLVLLPAHPATGLTLALESE